MQKTVILVLSVLALLLFPTNTPAKTKMVDVVHLKNGNVIKGEIMQMTPNETIKIETADGSIFVYEMSEVEKMTKVRKQKTQRKGFQKYRIKEIRMQRMQKFEKTFVAGVGLVVIVVLAIMNSNK